MRITKIKSTGIITFFLLLVSTVEAQQSTSVAKMDVNFTHMPVAISHFMDWGQEDVNDYQYLDDDSGEFIPLPALGTLWLGGLDVGGNLKIAAQTYGSFNGNTDFWPGPINAATGLAGEEDYINWDKHFVITADEIEFFLNDWSDGTLDELIPLPILKWPAKGNKTFYVGNGFELPNQDLAPFVDTNGNGTYEPDQGDYPDINGAEKAIWWVYNDVANVHTQTNADALQFEIQMMAYAYLVSSNLSEALNYSVLYDVTLINRSFELIDALYTGLWFDIFYDGCPVSLGGCQPEEDIAFFWSNPDEYCSCSWTVTPCVDVVTGVKLLKGPIGPLNIAANGDSYPTPFGAAADTYAEIGMSSFMMYNNGGIGSSPAHTTDPGNGQEYYHYLTGRYRDGSIPIQNGAPTSFMYAGNPADVDNYTMCSEETLGDFRSVMGIGPMRMESGASNKFTFAITSLPYSDTYCPDTDILVDELNQMQEVWNGFVSTSISPLVNSIDLSVYPNPMAQEVSIELKNSTDQIEKISLFSLDGRLVKQVDGLNSSKQLIERDNLTSGMYFYQLTTTGGQQYTGKLVME